VPSILPTFAQTFAPITTSTLLLHQCIGPGIFPLSRDTPPSARIDTFLSSRFAQLRPRFILTMTIIIMKGLQRSRFTIFVSIESPKLRCDDVYIRDGDSFELSVGHALHRSVELGFKELGGSTSNRGFAIRSNSPLPALPTCNLSPPFCETNGVL